MAGDLTLALRTAQSGLLTQQGALNAVSNNIANVNTEGYSRKNVNLETRVLAGNGAGVQLADFTRQIDEGLLKSLRLEKSAFEELDIQDNYYSRLQELFGSPEDNRSLSHLTSEFVAALETLAAAPDETISQSEVARWAGEITMVLQEMSETIQDLRMQADNEIADVSIEINNQIAAIGELNDKIVRNDSVGQDTSDLRDQRDLLITEVFKWYETAELPAHRPAGLGWRVALRRRCNRGQSALRSLRRPCSWTGPGSPAHPQAAPLCPSTPARSSPRSACRCRGRGQ